MFTPTTIEKQKESGKNVKYRHLLNKENKNVVPTRKKCITHKIKFKVPYCENTKKSLIPINSMAKV